MQFVILDKDTLGEDIDLSPITALGETTVYGTTLPEEVESRIEKANVVIINKIKLGGHNLKNATDLKLICVAATGYDNIDTAYCKENDIAVCNVPGYSTDSVAQITVTIALALASHLKEYENYVNSGDYTASGVANRLIPVYHDLAGKTWGVVGGGNIGMKVAQIAKALGCNVQVCRRKQDGEYPVVDNDTLCKTSDVISIHTPLTDSTRNLINKERIAQMKPNAIIVNTARGAVTDEKALADAVKQGIIGGFGTDVYSVEPFSSDHPFNELRNFPNVIMTPHMAWGSFESRARCVSVIAENIKNQFNGTPQNRIV